MIYSSNHVTALLDAARRAGIDVRARAAEICSLADPRVGAASSSRVDSGDSAGPIEAAQFEALLALCLAVSGNPALGLLMGEQASLVGLGLSEVPSASRAGSLRVVIETFNAGYCASIDASAPVLAVREDEATLSFPVHGESEAVRRLRAEYGVTLGLLLLRAWAGPFATPCWISFPHEAPSYVGEYQRLFGDLPRFGAQEAAIGFSAELLRAPVYPWGRQLVRPSSTRYAVPKACAGDRVRRFLVLQATAKRPDMAEIAAHLGMTERTLRRRLAAEGIRFRELWDEAQRERALSLALDLAHTPDSASEALGFSEVSAFYRAFKRWTGFTPTQYRAMHMSEKSARQPDLSLRSA